MPFIPSTAAPQSPIGIGNVVSAALSGIGHGPFTADVSRHPRSPE
jgi:hypothetical protein